MIRVYVPRDSAALSVGAEQVARAIATEAAVRGHEVHLVRNGSRGLLWLEPMVEVETPAGRVAYGPVEISDVVSLFDAGFLQGKPHELSLGLTEQHPYFAKQERLTFARVGTTDPVSIADYEKYQGYRGLRNALDQSGAAIALGSPR